MIYDDIMLTAFCNSSTMDKISETLEVGTAAGLRYVTYDIVTIYESKHILDDGCLFLIKNKDYEKLEERRLKRCESVKAIDAFINSFKIV